MKGRLARSIALSMVGAFAATVEGASSRMALSGGPVSQGGTAVLAQGSVTRAAARRVRPLEPGEMIVIGPTATPLSAPPIPARAPARVIHAPSATAVSPAVDTVTVRPPVKAESWETVRSGDVIRIDLPRN